MLLFKYSLFILNSYQMDGESIMVRETRLWELPLG